MKKSNNNTFQPKGSEIDRIEELAKFCFKPAAFLAQYKLIFAVIINCLMFTTFAVFPSFAQTMPNPFGGSGTTKLANSGSNIMVIATWAAFFVGLLAFALIPVFIFVGWDYKKNIIAGITGMGFWIILGSIAYDIVNLSSIDMEDPTIGN